MVLLLTIVVGPPKQAGPSLPLGAFARSRFHKSLCFCCFDRKILWSKVGSVYYFPPPRPMLPVMMSSMYLEMGLTRTLFCNRHKTKDVIFSIILGFTAIFTVLLLDGTIGLMFVWCMTEHSWRRACEFRESTNIDGPIDRILWAHKV